VSGTLTGYAYETIPNKAILAGQITGPDVITVQPETLGGLARGKNSLSSFAESLHRSLTFDRGFECNGLIARHPPTIPRPENDENERVRLGRAPDVVGGQARK